MKFGGGVLVSVVKRISAFIVVTAMLITSVPIVTMAAQEEQIYQNGFENSDESWEMTSNNGTIIAGKDSIHKSGEMSYKFSATSAVSNAEEKKEISKVFDVEYKKYYRVDLSYLINNYSRKNGSDGGAYIAYEMLNENVESIENYKYCISSEKEESGQWQDISIFITPSKKTTKVKIKIGFSAATGQVNFDDFSLSEIDKSQVKINPISKKQSGGDVPESYRTGFEDGDTDYWRYTIRSGDAEVGITDETSHSGEKSFKFYSVSTNKDPSNNTALSNNKNGEVMFKLEPGVYEVSFWYNLKDYKRYNNQHGATFGVSPYNGGTEIKGYGTTKTFDVKEDTGGEWKQYSFTTTIPEEGDRLRVNFGFRASIGTYIIDDIEIKPVLTGLVTTPDNEHYNGVTVKKSDEDTVSVDIDYKQATSSAILDTIILGNEESEKAHNFEAENSAVGYGGLGDTYRQLYPGEPAWFEVAVDPDKMNYLTVKMWGSEFPQKDRQHLSVTDEYGTFKLEYGTIWPDIDSMMHEQAQNDSYYYGTIRIPPQATKGRTKIKLKMYNVGNYNAYGATKYADAKEYSRQLYKIATHTEAEYIPQADDKSARTKRYDLTKTKVSPNGLSPYDYLINEMDKGVETILSRQNYGETWEKNVAEGLSPVEATGAYMEGTNSMRHGTWENWCKNVYYNTCVGSNSESMKGMRVAALAYESEWSEYYQNDEILDRCISWLDYMCRAQGSNGGYNNSVIKEWIGGPDRQPATNAINAGERTIGEVFLMLHDKFEEKGYMNQLIDDDLDPSTPMIERSKAYENMFAGISNYMFEGFDRRTSINQDMFNIIAGTAAEQCLEILNPSRCRDKDNLKWWWYTSTGFLVAPHGSIQFSPKGLSLETHGHLNGAYDGNYGMHGASMVADLAMMTSDENLKKKAVAAANALTYFQETITDSEGYVAIRKEDAINTRNTYTPGRVEYTAWNNFNALWSGSKDALRELELYIQYGEIYRAPLDSDSQDLYYVMKMFNMVGDKIKEASKGYKTFADINGIEEEGAIVTLAWKGIIDGVNDLVFKPDERIDEETFDRWLNNAFGNTTEIPYSILYTRAEAAQIILQKLYDNEVDVGRFDLGSGIYLPNEPWNHEDYVYNDEIAESYAWKLHDNEMFRCTMNWRSEYKDNTRSRAVATTSEVFRYHMMRDEYSSVGCAYMTSPLGLRRVDIAKYGKYIIISNVSDENKDVNIDFSADIKSAKDIISGEMINLNEEVTVKPLSTIILNLEETENENN